MPHLKISKNTPVNLSQLKDGNFYFYISTILVKEKYKYRITIIAAQKNLPTLVSAEYLLFLFNLLVVRIYFN